MAKRPTHAFPEAKRKAGIAGRKASPWSQGPNCCTPQAQLSFKKGKRLHLIVQAAKKIQEPQDE